jgi:hypothetical protein
LQTFHTWQYLFLNTIVEILFQKINILLNLIMDEMQCDIQLID